MHFALLLLLVTAVERVDVRVSGIGFTSEAAVRRLMSTKPGEAFDAELLERDLVRLRTLGILYDVTARSEGDGRRVEVSVKDRWSLLPVLGLRRGGGRTTARAGVSDHNVAGQLATLYGELTSNSDLPFLGGGKLGSYFLGEVPRIFATRLSPGLSWTRDFLDFAAFGTDGQAHYLYDRSRHDLRAEARYEITDRVALTAGVEVLHDRFSSSALAPAPGTPPRAVDATSAVARLQLGQIEEIVSLSRGRELKLELSGSRKGVLGSSASAVNVLAAGRLFLIPRQGHNLCAQLLLLGTTGQSDSFLFRAGGLREIRGFVDAFFEGQLMARANLEYRLDVLRLTAPIPAIGQIAAFTDGGWVTSRAGAVAGLDYQGPIESVGVGVRYIPIPFARVVGRLDLAVGIIPRRTLDISFSGQQFF